MATQEQVYAGRIKLSGMPPFDFDTKAVSERKARSNGLAQFARRLNMSIAALNSQLKNVQHVISVSEKVK
jgi:hypothetical protein